MSAEDPIHIARRVLSIEADAIRSVSERLGEQFGLAVDLLLECKGKVVVSGMGKSGLVAKKIAATFASTGTPAFFVHPAEGVHGDLGMIGPSDICLLISYSGETGEILAILPTLKRLGAKVIAMAGSADSTLGRAGDVFLDINVPEEACPLGLAPTASTTATMALGDALAVVLLEKRGFTEEDFALFHPSGSLGRKLLLRVEDLMHGGADHPEVNRDMKMTEVIVEISQKRLGVTAVVDDSRRLLGVITDGDLRRGLENHGEKMLSMKAADFMNEGPKRIERTALAMKAVHLMEKHSITNLFVTEPGDNERAVATLHLHDVLKAKLV
jgi:arabinose-5-phosphate isomerase